MNKINSLPSGSLCSDEEAVNNRKRETHGVLVGGVKKKHKGVEGLENVRRRCVNST